MTSTDVDRIVVVGGGVAAQRCAWRLRALGFAGSLTMVSAEEHLPYDRTLVSKDMLRAEVSTAEAALRPRAGYADAGIDLRLGTRAARIEPQRSRLLLQSGEELAYDRLVVCTGGAPLRPRSLQHPRAHVVREPADAHSLREQLLQSRRLTVIGGGVLGGEVAAAAAGMGVDVVLIEAAPEPLAPVLGAEVGARIRALHEHHGVEVARGSTVTRLRGVGRAIEVELVDGRVIRSDAVVIAVGMRPAVDWLEGSGLTLDNGIVTDELCRTSVPDVLAAGDCARWHNPRYATHMRVEHWHMAARHGEAAAATALGAGEPFAPVPFWWTDIYGVKLQFVGRCTGSDRVELDDVGFSQRSFAARYWCGDELIAVGAAGQPRIVAEGRRQLESNLWEPSLAA